MGSILRKFNLTLNLGAIFFRQNFTIFIYCSDQLEVNEENVYTDIPKNIYEDVSEFGNVYEIVPPNIDVYDAPIGN